MIHTSRAIVIKDTQVLLIYRNDHGHIRYTIPGGKKEKHETLEEAVVREVYEETRIDVTPIKHLNHIYDSEIHRVHHLFICKYEGGIPRLEESEELSIMMGDPKNYYRPEWVEIETALQSVIYPPVCEEEFKEFIKNNVTK